MGRAVSVAMGKVWEDLSLEVITVDLGGGRRLATRGRIHNHVTSACYTLPCRSHYSFSNVILDDNSAKTSSYIHVCRCRQILRGELERV